MELYVVLLHYPIADGGLVTYVDSAWTDPKKATERRLSMEGEFTTVQLTELHSNDVAKIPF